MKKFQFRLDTLLKYRQMQNEQAQLKFMQASQVLHEEKEKFDKLTIKLTESIVSFRKYQDSSPIIDELKDFQNYFDKIRENIKHQSMRVNEAQAVQQERLQELQQAAKNYEIVEKFRVKRLLQYQADALSEEQKYLDELGLQNYVRKS
ncbi:MAG: flagellar export protein FliJ [Negativicutes bacterium]|jgi:flagellar FliJ protein